MCVSHSLCSFTHFQGSGLLQRELIHAFFLAFAVATLTRLQRGYLTVATILLGNKGVRHGVFCRVQRMPFCIKWNPKNPSGKSLFLSDIHKWQQLLVSRKRINNMRKKDALSVPALNFLLFSFILTGFVS